MKKTLIKSLKLSLNKETLRKLSDDNLAAVQGGAVIISVAFTKSCPVQSHRACLSTNVDNTLNGAPC